jgi:hypothetical protein
MVFSARSRPIPQFLASFAASIPVRVLTVSRLEILTEAIMLLWNSESTNVTLIPDNVTSDEREEPVVATPKRRRRCSWSPWSPVETTFPS